jgi:hypothetical protein
MYGPEKSGKSLLALYLGACCAVKVPVLGAHATKKMDVEYLDEEDGVVGQYLVWLRRVGSCGAQGRGLGMIRFFTLAGKEGVPALNNAAPCDGDA